MEELLQFVSQFDFRNDWWVLFTPLIIMGVDIITGVVKAWVNKNFEASIMRTGLGKKAGEVAILIAVELLSYALNLPDIVMNCVSFYIIFMEVMSVLENADELGIPVPKLVRDVINNVDDKLQHGDKIEEE